MNRALSEKSVLPCKILRVRSGYGFVSVNFRFFSLSLLFLQGKTADNRSVVLALDLCGLASSL